MSAKIIKLNKNNLEEIDYIEIGMDNIKHISIEHIHDGTLSSSFEFNFEIEAFHKFFPTIKDDKKMIAICEELNALAIKSNDKILMDIGDKVGNKMYNEEKPPSPSSLPFKFKEIKK